MISIDLSPVGSLLATGSGDWQARICKPHCSFRSVCLVTQRFLLFRELHCARTELDYVHLDASCGVSQRIPHCIQATSQNKNVSLSHADPPFPIYHSAFCAIALIELLFTCYVACCSYHTSSGRRRDFHPISNGTVFSSRRPYFSYLLCCRTWRGPDNAMISLDVSLYNVSVCDVP